MLPTETELFLELVEHFQFVSNIVFFILGTVVGFALYIFMDSFVNFVMDLTERRRNKKQKTGESK